MNEDKNPQTEEDMAVPTVETEGKSAPTTKSKKKVVPAVETEGRAVPTTKSKEKNVSTVETEDMAVPTVGSEERIISTFKRFSRDKRRLYKECHVAGLSFTELDDIWDELCVGTKLVLVRERNNPHDGNAVAVGLPCEYDGDPDNFDFDSKLGYVPKIENADIANLLDMGWQDIFDCEITSLSRRVGGDITFKIYFRNRWFLEDGRDYDALRIANLDDSAFLYFTGSLSERGFVYFRWGGYPFSEHDLPFDGDKVVFVRKEGETVKLYLTRVVASGDDCLPFVKSVDELNRIDDCEPFVLTNIKGPVVVDTESYPFLKELGDLGDQPDCRLSKETTERFNRIFENL